MPKSPAEFGPDLIKSQTVGFGNFFAYKIEDPKGRVHRFNCGKDNCSISHLCVCMCVSIHATVPCMSLFTDDACATVCVGVGAVVNVCVHHTYMCMRVTVLCTRMMYLHICL